MAENPKTVDRNLADSIAMLEQILEVMPHDADALKALYSAHRKMGEDKNAFEYLNRIIDLHIGGNETGLLPFIRNELNYFEAKHPSEVAAHTARLRMTGDGAVASARSGDAVGGSSSGDRKAPRKNEVDISEELALAWRLYEDGQLSQEEYSTVLHDLTEVSSKEVNVPVSVLHVLSDRAFNQMNRIMNYLSSRSGAPTISLSNFEISEEVANSLPLDAAAHDGALPFAFLGNNLLVAVLNPFNNVLVDKIESDSGHRCHTYLVTSEDYDIALGKLRTILAKATAPSQP